MMPPSHGNGGMIQGRPGAAPMPAVATGDGIRQLLLRLSPVFLVVGLWLTFHPYVGIVHDSRLYIVQALHALRPEVFGRDLFFAFGSQDDFTLFSHLFAPLVGALGPFAASVVTVAVAHALWLSGAAALALRLAPNARAAVAGLVLLAGLPGFYGGWQLVTIGEGFATPRVVAESISLWALWALVGPCPRKALVLATVLMGLVALLHPLVALTALGVGFVFLLMQDRRWSFLGIAGAIGVGIAVLAGVAPFDRLLQTMDAEWRGLVEQRNVFLFPSLWKPVDWGRIALAASTVLAAAVLLEGWRRRLLLAIAITGLGGLLATMIGADLFGNLLLIQIQPWRALWLLQVFACLGGGLIFHHLWQLRDDGFALIAIVVFAWLLCLALLPPLGAALTVVTLAITVARVKGWRGPLSKPAQVTFIALAALTIGVVVTYRIVRLLEWGGTAGSAEAFWDVFGYLTIVDIAAAAAVALTLLRYAPDFTRRALPVAALALLVVSAAAWDRRGEWTRTVAAEPPAAFDSLLAPDARVYWEGSVRGAWLLLDRPSYVSMAQGAGIAFDRRTAIAFQDRVHVVEGLTGHELIDWHRAYDRDARPRPPPLEREQLAAACRADHALDAMVLSRAVPGAFAAAWSPPVPVFDGDAIRKGAVRPPIRTFYLYLCEDLR